MGEDGVLAAVDDGQDLALPRGQLGLCDHLPLLVDSEEVSLLVSGVEDGVVGLVLLLATHRGDGVVGDLGAEGDVAVLKVDRSQFAVDLDSGQLSSACYVHQY